MTMIVVMPIHHDIYDMFRIRFDVVDPVHDYNYTRDSWNATEYAVPRFASEFGLQSWCSPETLAVVSWPTVDWDLNSSFVSHRQHHPHGL